jgi:outer membrane protein OmpA-like peptidoglycan-associated protein
MIRGALLAGTAMAAVLAGLPPEAAAQSQTPGFFGSLSGWYYFPAGHNPKHQFKGMSVTDPFNRPSDGFGGKVHLGYRFASPFDLAFGLQGSWLSARKSNQGPTTLRSSANYWAVDGELGYNTMLGGVGLRLFAGARYAQFDHRNKSTGLVDGLAFVGHENNDYAGIGPRVGTDFSARLGNSNFSIFGDAAGSVLFGTLKRSINNSGGPMLVCDDGCHGHNSQTVLNVEGQLGLAYELSPGINLGVGYRAEYWRHVGDGHIVLTMDGLGREHQVSRLMHGPFVRLAYNFGAPTAAPVMAVTPPPGQPAVTKKSFIVFFDFDRSNVTAEGQKTINDAAAAAKAGNAAQVSVTGHADRAGSEQYNLALSMRRAEVVKAGLIRLGVPASLIVVVAKGESQPLVNTADGVREPQNRRVEILI